MTLWVALETSSRRPSIALHEGTQRAQRELGEQRAHASDLLPTLEELLLEHSRTPSAIGAIAIGTGPGSYTGLRVGIATALGLARATGAALVALPSMAALAYGELAAGEECLIVANAHAGALYLARYGRTAEDVETLEEPSVAAADVARDVIQRHAGRILADVTSSELLDLEALAAARLTVGAVPHATPLLELARHAFATRGASDPDAIEPLYLRPFRAKPRRR